MACPSPRLGRAPLAGLRLGLLVAALLWPSSLLAMSEASVTPPADTTHFQVSYVRAPRGALSSRRPLQVLVALHGMGGTGEEFARDLAEYADRYGWLVVAPTIEYGDWRDPAQVAREDPVLIHALAEYLDALPRRTGLATRKQVLLFGHSRGAQLAHRFAEVHPGRVLAVAALSAGTYTLPLATGPQGRALAFPFGVKDLAAYTGQPFDPAKFNGVRLWVGVGSEDDNPAELPRQWDPYEGRTRVQRARAFEAAARQLGAESVLEVFGGARHGLTAEMRAAACRFLGGAGRPAGTHLALAS